MKTKPKSEAGERTRHTPGPWFVDKSYSETEGNFLAVWHKNPGEKFWQRIAKMHDYKSSAEANARLIAAAPDLLKACQNMLDTYAPKRDEKDRAPLHSAVLSAIDAIREATEKGERA